MRDIQRPQVDRHADSSARQREVWAMCSCNSRIIVFNMAPWESKERLLPFFSAECPFCIRGTGHWLRPTVRQTSAGPIVLSTNGCPALSAGPTINKLRCPPNYRVEGGGSDREHTQLEGGDGWRRKKTQEETIERPHHHTARLPSLTTTRSFPILMGGL